MHRSCRQALHSRGRTRSGSSHRVCTLGEQPAPPTDVLSEPTEALAMLKGVQFAIVTFMALVVALAAADSPGMVAGLHEAVAGQDDSELGSGRFMAAMVSLGGMALLGSNLAPAVILNF
ncbi:unnamed protein product [Prorocentrum cordatum]|nr:unnamed protein product [Polarella glacialis]